MIIRAETTNITSTEYGRHTVTSRELALALLSVAVALGASAACARAEVSIHGDRAAVHLEASNAQIDEVLSALESTFSIRHRTSVPLDQAISGTYRGPLRRVLSRVLDGFNYYVANTAEGGMEITVVGKPGAAVVGNLPSPVAATPQVVAASQQKLVVPPPTEAEVAAERQRLHHRRPR
jgi:hypothetical protein